MTIKNIAYFSVATLLVGLIVGQAEAAVKVPFHPKRATSESSGSLENSTNCKELISHFEKLHNIPEKLLLAIATVESKKSPWAVNALRKSRFFPTKEAAVQYIQKLKAQGVKNINIGCMQINLQSHGRKFNNIADILTPYNNIAYAAKLMKMLHAHYGSWEEAVKYYHSSSSIYHAPYIRKVYSTWAHTKGEIYQPTGETVSWTTPSTTQPKRPLVKIVMGPGAGVLKHYINQR